MLATYIILFIATLLLEIAIIYTRYSDNSNLLTILIFTYIGIMSAGLVYYSCQTTITVAVSGAYMAMVLFLVAIFSAYSKEEDFKWFTERWPEFACSC